jgi:hypothetical protein
VKRRNEESPAYRYFSGDPFMEYGFGVLAFFKIIKTLIFLFFWLSLTVALPEICTYASMDSGNQEAVYPSFPTTLAALGFSYNDKYMAPLKLDRLYMICENSFIADIGVFGVLPPNTTYWSERITAFSDQYPDPCPHLITENAKFYANKYCLGQKNCLL